MASRYRVPKLANPNIVIRLAHNQEEVEAANRLVFRNYVEDGFWENDETQLQTNKFLHSPARIVFVVLDEGNFVGTMSLIEDSRLGLPSDSTQAALMQQLRNSGDKLAEISAFAMDRSKTSYKNLFIFLWSYMLQYSFYYAEIDRLVASCKPKHADFY